MIKRTGLAGWKRKFREALRLHKMCVYFNIIKMSFHSLLSERILRDKDVPQRVKVPADSLATRVGVLDPYGGRMKLVLTGYLLMLHCNICVYSYIPR